ncbi:hypothetical protein LguiA_027818 [Lonicera macranthoides]
MNNYAAVEDWISQLPDEILIKILSLLRYAEVARTCVLSKRWKYLWTFAKCLNFDVPTNKLIAIKYRYSEKLIKRDRPKYVNWVNRALQLHMCSDVTEFIVSFPLGSRNSCDIDKWLMFVMGKRVERLEVDLFPDICQYSGHTPSLYTFSDEVYSIFKSPCGLSSIKSLTQLTLKFVNLPGEVVEHFLSNCPVLERLCVWGSKLLVTLKVDSSSSRCLRFLEISTCYNIEYVDIYAPNLVSFIFTGMRQGVQVLVRHAPALSDLTIGIIGGSGQLYHGISAFSSYFSQLESLTLRLSLFSWEFEVPNSPELPNLKKLTLDVSAKELHSFLDWTSFIERSPLLQRFTMKLRLKRERGYIRVPHKCVHKCLKVVEFVRNIDLELAMYFIQNAVALEKIVVDCRPQFSSPQVVFTEDERSMYLRKRVEELRTQLPHDGINLVTLPCIQDPTCLRLK